MPVTLRTLLPFVLATLSLAAAAQQTVYRCVDAAGRTGYQAEPCPEARQSELRLPAVPPAPAQPRQSAWKSPEPVRTAAFTLYYDPAEEPMEFPTSQMEAAIRHAIKVWSAGCQVELRYAGKAPHRAPGSPERVSIRWVPAYLRASHPAHPRTGIAGTGSILDGIALTPRFAEGSLTSTLVHEMGHVLGLPHKHEDLTSVMSYLRDDKVRAAAQPSASDYHDCNLSMQRMFGIDYRPPADAPARRQGPRMSDREVLEKMRGPADRP